MAKKPTISKKEKQDPVFLPFDYESHKENKVILMKAELSALKCMRVLENLKRLQDEKGKLRRELQHLFSSSLRDFEKTMQEIPLVERTGEIKRIEKAANIDFGEEYEQKLQSLSMAGSDKTALGKELSVIQDKLKKLSNYQ